MKRHIFFFIVFIILSGACSPDRRSENPEKWSEDQVNEWFQNRDWLGDASLQPDPAIDRRALAKHYYRYKKRWDIAFTFIRNGNFEALEAGDYPLDGNDVFVKVSQYDSKDPEEVFYESHNHYTDIHFVVSGREHIGASDLKDASVRTPYDAERDITFYNVSNGRKLLAEPGIFFIFFPGYGHCPGMSVSGKAPVKKIVIKVRS
jgi:biofilm protein TabA